MYGRTASRIASRLHCRLSGRQVSQLAGHHACLQVCWAVLRLACLLAVLFAGKPVGLQSLWLIGEPAGKLAIVLACHLDGVPNGHYAELSSGCFADLPACRPASRMTWWHACQTACCTYCLPSGQQVVYGPAHDYRRC
jgi:hypothetical protein